MSAEDFAEIDRERRDERQRRDPELRLLFMPTFTDLLHQQVIWRDASGRVWRIEEMELRHRRNLINWLERNAERIKNAVEWRMAATPGPTAEMASLAFEEEQARLWETDARDWLDATPLMRKLRKVQRKAAGL